MRRNHSTESSIRTFEVPRGFQQKQGNCNGDNLGNRLHNIVTPYNSVLQRRHAYTARDTPGPRNLPVRQGPHVSVRRLDSGVSPTAGRLLSCFIALPNITRPTSHYFSKPPTRTFRFESSRSSGTARKLPPEWAKNAKGTRAMQLHRTPRSGRASAWDRRISPTGPGSGRVSDPGHSPRQLPRSELWTEREKGRALVANGIRCSR